MNLPGHPSKEHVIIDTQQKSTPVARFTYPGDWLATSQVTWRYENASQPVSIYSMTYDPIGLGRVEMLPVESFYWLQPNFGMERPGAFKMGQFCLQPMKPEDALLHWIIPRFRGNCQNLQVKTVSPVPDLPQRLKIMPQQVPVYGVCARIEFQENNRDIEEEVYGAMIIQPGVPSYGAGGTIVQTNWGFIRLFFFRAARNELAKNLPLYWQIIDSIATNPTWEQQVYNPLMAQLQQQFQQYLQAGYDQINAATQMSRMISAQNNAFLQQQEQKRNDDWQRYEQDKQQQAAQYGQYTREEAFGDAMMGQEAYHDPYYQYGSKHTGYNQYVWTNGQGEYQYSNDANFNPNLGAIQNWTLMEKKNLGDT